MNKLPLFFSKIEKGTYHVFFMIRSFLLFSSIAYNSKPHHYPDAVLHPYRLQDPLK